MSSGRAEWEFRKSQFLREGGKTVRRWRAELSSKQPTPQALATSTVSVNDSSNNVTYMSADDAASQGPLLPAQPPHEYVPLPASCIRTLRLLPSSNKDAPIQCRLSVIELRQASGTYDPLSYVWGDLSQPKETITLDGRSKQIYQNLHTILVHLRKTDTERVLWVDALCINQDDIQERNVQVPLMRNIYRDGVRTLVWLGSERRSTPDTFLMLYELAAEARSNAWSQQYQATDDTDTYSISLLQSNQTAKPTRQSIVKSKYSGDSNIFKVISTRWWRRAWTLQELLLSRSVSFLNGDYEIDWPTLCLAVDYGIHLELWYLWDLGFVLNQAIMPFQSLRTIDRRHRARLETSCAVDKDTSTEHLLHLLLHCRHREARDPRDKIYALLGMLYDGQTSQRETSAINIITEPDYGNPVVYIYRMVSQQLIQGLGNLDVLGVGPVSNRRGLPSWVTDWSITGPSARPMMIDSIGRSRVTHASGGRRGTPRFPHDAVTMVLHAHEVSIVTELADVLHAIHWDEGSPGEISSGELLPDITLSDITSNLSPSDIWQAVKSANHEISEKERGQVMYWRTIFAWEAFAAKQQVKNPGERVEAVLWQTLCVGTYKDGSVDKTEVLYRQWLENLATVRDMDRWLGSWSSKLMMTNTYARNPSSWRGYSEFARYIEGALERRLAWAANGYLCLLPAAAEVGDRIILAEGGRVPLVIRADGDGYNMLIGEAYVQGIMDGEGFDINLCGDIKIC